MKRNAFLILLGILCGVGVNATTFIVADTSADVVDVYRFWSPVNKCHFYTASETERDKLINEYSHVWTYEGIAFSAFSADGHGWTGFKNTLYPGNVTLTTENATVKAIACPQCGSETGWTYQNGAMACACGYSVAIE